MPFVMWWTPAGLCAELGKQAELGKSANVEKQASIGKRTVLGRAQDCYRLARACTANPPVVCYSRASVRLECRPFATTAASRLPEVRGAMLALRSVRVRGRLARPVARSGSNAPRCDQEARRGSGLRLHFRGARRRFFPSFSGQRRQFRRLARAPNSRIRAGRGVQRERPGQGAAGFDGPSRMTRATSLITAGAARARRAALGRALLTASDALGAPAAGPSESTAEVLSAALWACQQAALPVPTLAAVFSRPATSAKRDSHRIVGQGRPGV